MKPHWLITGASGYVGSLLVERLLAMVEAGDLDVSITGLDIVPNPRHQQAEGYDFVEMDVRDEALGDLLISKGITQVAHLASVVDPSHRSDANLEYEVDVLGTRNVLDACIRAGIDKIVVTSSGAAYGYHADNPFPIEEDAPLRGNEEFSYARNKKAVEGMLAEYRDLYPRLKQIILRLGTIVGPNVNNRISAFLEGDLLLRVSTSESPFVFISEPDVAGVLVAALQTDQPGIYNVAGDGTLTLREIAQVMGSRVLSLPEWFLRLSFSILKFLGASRYGAELVTFLKYRPVLSNRRLKEELYTPRHSSRVALEIFANQHEEMDQERHKARKERLRKLTHTV